MTIIFLPFRGRGRGRGRLSSSVLLVVTRKMLVLPCISLPIFLVLFPILTQSRAQISLGSKLIPSDSNSNPNNWTSLNHTFSLSFIPITSSTYSASISFSGVRVWTAGGLATPVDRSSIFHFLLDGNLRLTNGSGSIIWESHTANLGVTTATLDDYGSLSLKNNSITVWSTFDYPTDTILPTQNFTTSHTLRSGPYSFNLETNGNLTLRWNSVAIYWNQGLNSSFSTNLTSPSLGLQSTGVLQLFDPTLSFPVRMAYSTDFGEGTDVLRFVKLDSDGNLRIYSSARSSGVSVQSWAAVSDQCEVYGWCGNMGICSYNDSEPVCSCPSQNFEFLDPNDSRKGCRRKVEIKDCQSTTTLLQLNHTQFLTYQPELSSQEFIIGILACKSNCLSSVSCLAATTLADGTGTCYLKTYNFISGYQSAALPSTSFLKVCGPVLLNPSVPDGRHTQPLRLHAWVVVVIVLCAIFGMVLLECGLWWFCCRKRLKFGGLSAQYALLQYASGAPVQFSYQELQHSTKRFKDKLGAGSFGAVYRGVLANRTVVAVKRLEGIEQGEKQFRMEVATISNTHHLNLVRLIGFCSEGRHRLLVYEFMSNGSLDNFLFPLEERSGRLLDWQTRFHIALGTAKGVTYLHEQCRDSIVHCDIKPENILLDQNHNAKVSDFGLAKLLSSKDHQYRTLTSVRGTRGYLAPEWLANLPVTSKSDVYSYGMVLLEIVSGRRNFEVSEYTGRKKFSLWAYEEFVKGNINAIVDKSLAEEEVDMEQVTRMIGISFWCIQEQPSKRPKMGKVVQMLEGVTTVEHPPALTTIIEGSVTYASGNLSSNTSAFSIFAGSAPGEQPPSIGRNCLSG